MTARITFREVSKTFRRRNRSDALRDAIPRALGRLVGRRTPPPEPFVALDRLSFELAEREVLGIVGANGAGKSTTLRLAAGVYTADAGDVAVRGRISALIELSAGFHPDLSGRENIHLVGALHGLRRSQVAGSVEAIAEFADIGEFLDAPVRTYSTGMAVRLGFSVAAHVPAEILLVDEVLAVGDADFRAKCLRRMAERRDDGVSVLFVSHNLQVLEQFCDRLLFVHRGRIASEGDPATVIADYRRTIAAERHRRDGVDRARLRQGTHDLRLDGVSINGVEGGQPATVACGAGLGARGTWRAEQRLTGVVLRLRFHTVNGVLCGAASCVAPALGPGAGSFAIDVPSLGLLPGAYDVSLEARDSTGLVLLDLHERLYPLTISGDRPPGAEGVVHIASQWRITPDGSR